MSTAPRTPEHVKVCCIASEAEARLAIRLGADALGLVSSMPSGPGVIDEASIARIAAIVPTGIETFLLTRHTAAAAIVDQWRRVHTTTLQLVDHVAFEDLARVREALPGVRIVQVIHVRDEGSITEALAVTPYVDALLLDSGRPDAAVPELGGTGRVHDWSVSRAIVQEAPVPVYLAGGLRPENVAEAVRRVAPFGLDVCSGVRVDGRLDEARLVAFLRGCGR